MPKARGKRNKKLRPVLHIFCEGSKTEPNYINGYLETFHPGNRLLKVVRVEKSRKTTPVQLVKEARNQKNDRSTPKSDQFWVVYDREAEAKYANHLHQQAFDIANSRGIGVALTNVCFEVWLLLHFLGVTASYTSCQDLLRNSPLKGKLKELGLNDYDKADSRLFDLVAGEIAKARERAVLMNDATIAASHLDPRKPYLLNPYTSVHNLLDAIDEFCV